MTEQTMRGKAINAAEQNLLQQYEASDWETAKDFAEGFDAGAVYDAILSALAEPTPEMVDDMLSTYWNQPMDNEHFTKISLAITAAIRKAGEG